MGDGNATIAALREGSVADLTGRLEDADLATLLEVRKAEADDSDAPARSTALAAIDKAIAAHRARIDDEARAEGWVSRADHEAAIAERDSAHTTALAERDRVNAEAGASLIDASPVLDAMPLGALDQLRSVALVRAGGDATDAQVKRIEAAIDDLRKRSKDAPRVDVNKTETIALPTRAARDVIDAGNAVIRLLDNSGTPIEGIAPIEAGGRADWSRGGGVAVYQQAIRLGRDLPQVTINHAALYDRDGGLAGICEIPGGLRAGLGLEAELPAGSLAF